jgi:hypothetical protein
MNNTFEILVFLVFFAPIALMVALNLYMYREARYAAQPPAPMMPPAAQPRAAEPVAARVENEFDFRQAA